MPRGRMSVAEVSSCFTCTNDEDRVLDRGLLVSDINGLLRYDCEQYPTPRRLRQQETTGHRQLGCPAYRCMAVGVGESLGAAARQARDSHVVSLEMGEEVAEYYI